MSEFDVKDSGERRQFESGMQRDVEEGKVDYTLIFDGPLIERYAEHLSKGAQKYDARNWMLAEGEEELDRFRRSATRHFIQWLNGERDEDHAAAVVFNLNGYEYVRENLGFAERMQELGAELVAQTARRKYEKLAEASSEFFGEWFGIDWLPRDES